MGEREETFAEILQMIPDPQRERFRELMGLTDAFCQAHLAPLEMQYMVYCWMLAGALFLQPRDTPLPLDRAKPASWAAGILWALGTVNFLDDPDFEPVMKGEQVAEGFGVSPATMHAKARQIREELELIPLDPRYTLPALADRNPLIWMVELPGGVLADLRTAPREVQAMAFEQGLIPYIPADMEEDEEEAPLTDETLGGDIIGRIGPEEE